MPADSSSSLAGRLGSGSVRPARGIGDGRIGVVVVSYNTRELLDRCLIALRKDIGRFERPVDVIVVDNASTDGSAALVTANHAWARLVPAGTNLGYAAAVNLALEEWWAGSRPPAAVLVANPDTELGAGALERLMQALSDDPRIAVAGPGLVYPDGTFQHAAFRFPGLLQTILDLFPVPRLVDSRLNGRYPVSAYTSGRTFSVDFPLGACMLVRGSAISEVGPMDPDYFMYCEEIDWCLRFRRRGYTATCVPTARVVHHAGASTGQAPAEMHVRLWRSRLRLFQRHWPEWRFRLARFVVTTGLRLRARAERRAAARGLLSVTELESRLHAYAAILAK